MSIQEAVPIDDSSHLTRLFSSEVLGLLPGIGHDRIRRTMLGLIGMFIIFQETCFILIGDLLTVSPTCSLMQERMLLGLRLKAPKQHPQRINHC